MDICKKQICKLLKQFNVSLKIKDYGVKFSIYDSMTICSVMYGNLN